MKMELSFPRRAGELRMPVIVVRGDWPENDRSVRCEALWDTGTSTTTFSMQLIEALGLQRLDRPPITIHHPLGDRKAYLYEAQIVLRPDWKPVKLIVTEMPQPDTDVLIGMDIIGRGLFQTWPQGDEIIMRFEMR